MSTFERVLGFLASLIAVGTFVWAVATTFFGVEFALSFEPQAAKLPTPDMSDVWAGIASVLTGVQQIIQVIFRWASQNIVLKIFFYIVVMLIYALIFASLFVVPWVRRREPVFVPTFLSYLFFLGAVWVFDNLFVGGELRVISAAVLSGDYMQLENEGVEHSMCLFASLALYAFGVNAAASIARQTAEEDMDFFERTFKGGGAPAGSWTAHAVLAFLMALAALFTY
ncbi:hypothetical protein [Oceanicaulis sp.]|uniref:hypothetical protein n=1 Tax=Oceanicaulis sp. TaxID=1924941 RepID=UPI003F717E5F